MGEHGNAAADTATAQGDPRTSGGRVGRLGDAGQAGPVTRSGGAESADRVTRACAAEAGASTGAGVAGGERSGGGAGPSAEVTSAAGEGSDQGAPVGLRARAGRRGDRRGVRPAPIKVGRVGSADVVFGGLTVAVSAMVVLHLIGVGRLSPATTTVSDYVSLPGGAVLLALAVLGVAVATAAVPIRLALSGWLSALYWVGCCGLMATIAFPTNVLGTPSTETAVLHRYAAAVFFVSLAAAALLTPHRSRAARLLTWTSLVAGALFLISHIPLVFPGWPGAHEIAVLLPRGLMERALLLADMALVGSLAIGTSSREVTA